MAKQTGGKRTPKSRARQNTAQGKKEWKYFFMFAVTVVFADQQNNGRQRTVNILMEQEGPYITKADLSTVNRAAITRMGNETGVDPGSVREIIIENAFMLGHMHPDLFYEAEEADLSGE